MGETDVPTLVKADLHNWLATTNEFPESFFNKVVDRASKKLGPGGILGVVEASDEKRYGKFIELPGYVREDLGNAIHLWDKDLTIIRGERVFSNDKKGSVLVLGLKEENRMSHDRNLRDVFKEAKDKGGIIIYNPAYCTLPSYSYLEFVDAIEAHNGSFALKLGSNELSQKFYKSHRDNYPIGYIVTSGGHSIREIGSSWMGIPNLNKTDADSIKESLRFGISRNREPYVREEKKSNSHVMSAVHATKLFAPRIGWAERAKKRPVKNGIYQ